MNEVNSAYDVQNNPVFTSSQHRPVRTTAGNMLPVGSWKVLDILDEYTVQVCRVVKLNDPTAIYKIVRRKGSNA